MPTSAAITIYLFGLTAFAAGLFNLFSPQRAVDTMGLPETCIPAFNGNSLAAIGIGIYYTLAAAQENRVFFKLTVPMRLLTSFIFWGQGGVWKTVGLWEGGGAVLTGIALVVG